MSKGANMEVKCVVVGDGAVGKTCLLMAYTKGSFPEDYVPTVFDNYETTVEVHGEQVLFSLWDTAGQEGYQRIRILSYPKTDIFLLCYSIMEMDSLSNIKTRWYEELQKHCPSVPMILVGTKLDLREDAAALESLKRNDPNAVPVTREQGEQMKKELNFVNFFECSALTRQGLKDVFDEILSVVVTLKTKNRPAPAPEPAPVNNLSSAQSTSNIKKNHHLPKQCVLL
jgi:Ras-related C3 botulinum toxin substrate 1